MGGSDIGIAGWLDAVTARQSLNDFLRGQTISLHLLWIDIDDNGSLVSTKRWRRRDSGKCCKDRTNTIQREVLNLSERPGWTGKHHIPNRQSSGVVPDDKRGHRSGRHKSACAIHIRDRLRERLAHVCFRMKRQPQESSALDRLRLNALDSVDIEEVVLVVVGEEPFHLLWTHAAIGLSNINDWKIQIRKDVHSR